jgi:uncharacterized membrane protein YcaP (DUF421 family)
MQWLDTFNKITGESVAHISASQMSVRALIIFVYGVLVTRVGAWRAFGRWSTPDIVVAIIVGANLSRALTAGAPLIATIVATTVFVAAYWLVSFAATRSDWFDWFIKGGPIEVVSNGKVDAVALRKALVTTRDLHEALREKGLASAAGVISAKVERNGSITVIQEKEAQ